MYRSFDPRALRQSERNLLPGFDAVIVGLLGKFRYRQMAMLLDHGADANVLDKAGARVTAFVRFEVGEGIEKKQENFADEVMKQIEDAKQKG